MFRLTLMPFGSPSVLPFRLWLNSRADRTYQATYQGERKHWIQTSCTSLKNWPCFIFCPCGWGGKTCIKLPVPEFGLWTTSTEKKICLSFCFTLRTSSFYKIIRFFFWSLFSLSQCFTLSPSLFSYNNNFFPDQFTVLNCLYHNVI